MVAEQYVIVAYFFGKFEQAGSKNKCENKISKDSSSARFFMYDYHMEPP